MSDVSRVVYDAALKRVREARTWHDLNDLGCERITLAALGSLDEPPTEEASDVARDGAHLRPEDLACRRDDGPRRWTLPFCDGCGKIGRRTPDSLACGCGALTYSEAQAVDRCHLSEAERRIASLRDLIATLWLYVGRNGWTQLTTEQKELFADVVDADPVTHAHEGGIAVHRWWRAVPPTETPKACPTIPVEALREWINTEERGLPDCLDGAYEAGIRWAFDVLRDFIDHCGSGIDGGTP